MKVYANIYKVVTCPARLIKKIAESDLVEELEVRKNVELRYYDILQHFIGYNTT